MIQNKQTVFHYTDGNRARPFLLKKKRRRKGLVRKKPRYPTSDFHNRRYTSSLPKASLPKPPDDITESETNHYHEQFRRLVDSSENVIYKATSVFPFDLFPDTLVIDMNKIVLVERTFFLTKSVSPLLIKDLKLVSVSANPLFASMYIELLGFQNNPEPIHYLWKWQALKACRIIMGLVACYRERIDLHELKDDHLTEKLERIGQEYDEP